jgi:hypothetical protein
MRDKFAAQTAFSCTFEDDAEVQKLVGSLETAQTALDDLDYVSESAAREVTRYRLDLRRDDGLPMVMGSSGSSSAASSSHVRQSSAPILMANKRCSPDLRKNWSTRWIPVTLARPSSALSWRMSGTMDGSSFPRE